jgi:hypothetical protein
MYIVSFRVATKLIRNVSVYNISNSVRHSPLDRYANVANIGYQFLDFFNSSIVSLEDTFPACNCS